MKFFLIALMTIGVLTSLFGCDPASHYFDLENLSDNVLSVELIEYENHDVKIVKKTSEIFPFYFDKVEVIDTLDAEHKESFLRDLSEIHFHISDNLTKYSNSATGNTLRIVYNENEFLIICYNQKSNFVVLFNADGSVGKLIIRFTNGQDFAELVKKYFDI